ncbi:MAG TPA: hypothetical protein VF814_20930 [Casimicrobiaceae bacterium]
MSDLAPAARVPLLVLGFVALALGAAGGLARLGFELPAPAAGIAWHGALMASAFFGTLIALERAVAIGQRWAYAAPAASGAGGIVLLLGQPGPAFALFVGSAAVFVAVSASIFLRQRALHTGLLGLGTLALLAANGALAAGASIESVAPSWLAFFVLTIGGERLELSRLVPVPRAARIAFAAIAVALLAAALAAFFAAEPAMSMAGLLMIACSLWLARYDIAMRTVRAKALTRYIALCLLAGYVWLAVGGAALAWGGGVMAGRLVWDLALHAILIGFVFSMVFGHAPVILPAVLRIAFPYRAALYVPLAALHLTLALRVAGDIGASASLRAAGGAGNVASIALFIVTAAALVISGGIRKRDKRVEAGRAA